MKIVFRVDASLAMGTGHVMRCLTLADALQNRGADCNFIARAHSGNLIHFVREKGYTTYVLPDTEADAVGSSHLSHGHWLGVSQEKDAADCQSILASLKPDWLIVDHYGLDSIWEEQLRPYSNKLMVIDDLADRRHCCDLLLDQNLGRQQAQYQPLLANTPTLLMGTEFALLRPEFRSLRDYSLARRNPAGIKNILISLGGVDKDNMTERVLKGLTQAAMPDDSRITVIMGATAPWIDTVRRQAALMPWNTEVRVAINNMAELMAEADLAIGAAGSTSWERCCLGLPALLMVLAENQQHGARALADRQAALLVSPDSVSAQLNKHIHSLQNNPATLSGLVTASSAICDGLGAQRVVEKLIANL